MLLLKNSILCNLAILSIPDSKQRRLDFYKLRWEINSATCLIFNTLQEIHHQVSSLFLH